MGVVFRALCFGGFALLSACNFLPGSTSLTSTGVCKTTGGNVNTYTIYGVWKKTAGYATPKTTEELETNYDVLILEPGTDFCIRRVLNGSVTSTPIVGTYTHDTTTNTLTFTLDQASGSSGLTEFSYLDGSSATYGFSGSCDKTKMTWALPAASTGSETYTVFSKSFDGVNPCYGE